MKFLHYRHGHLIPVVRPRFGHPIQSSWLPSRARYLRFSSRAEAAAYSIGLISDIANDQPEPPEEDERFKTLMLVVETSELTLVDLGLVQSGCA